MLISLKSGAYNYLDEVTSIFARKVELGPVYTYPGTGLKIFHPYVLVPILPLGDVDKYGLYCDN